MVPSLQPSYVCMASGGEWQQLLAKYVPTLRRNSAAWNREECSDCNWEKHCSGSEKSSTALKQLRREVTARRKSRLGDSAFMRGRRMVGIRAIVKLTWAQPQAIATGSRLDADMIEI